MHVSDATFLAGVISLAYQQWKPAAVLILMSVCIALLDKIFQKH
jgi:hypothetical protein